MFGVAGSDECLVSVCHQEQSSPEVIQIAQPDSKFRSFNPGPIPIPAAPSVRSLAHSVSADKRIAKMCDHFDASRDCVV